MAIEKRQPVALILNRTHGTFDIKQLRDVNFLIVKISNTYIKLNIALSLWFMITGPFY